MTLPFPSARNGNTLNRLRSWISPAWLLGTCDAVAVRLSPGWTVVADRVSVGGFNAAMSPDGKWLAVARRDGIVSLVELAHPRAIREEFVQPRDLRILYLRKSDAEISWDERHGAGVGDPGTAGPGGRSGGTLGSAGPSGSAGDGAWVPERS